MSVVLEMQAIAGGRAGIKKERKKKRNNARADGAYLGNNRSSGKVLPCVFFFRFASDRLARTAFIMFG